jgi:hypothetical protein
MPVLINEVVAEVVEAVVPEVESMPLSQQAPLSPTEFEMAQTLALLEERRERLKID